MRQTAAACTAVVLLCYPCPSWSQDSTATLIAICDQAAAIPLDQSRPTGVAGVVSEKIDPKAAPRNRRIGSRRDVRRGFPTRVALHIMGS